MRFLFFIVLFSLNYLPLKAQENWKIELLDSHTGKAVDGAAVQYLSVLYLSNENGIVTFHCEADSASVRIQHLAYKTLSTTLYKRDSRNYRLLLEPIDHLLEPAIISASRSEENIDESTVSVDVIPVGLLERTGVNKVENILAKVPGLQVIDQQPNIRGGSGYSYGAGSRVLVLLDDIPIMQADAGFVQWNDIPIELIGQTEVLKGAGSALYGSAAMNGVINLRTREAGSKPSTQLSFFGEGIEGPQNILTPTPFSSGMRLSHFKKNNQHEWRIGLFHLNAKSSNKGVYDRYSRASLSWRKNITPEIRTGFNAYLNSGQTRRFFFWKGIDSLQTGAAGQYNEVQYSRFYFDPFVNFSKGKWHHRFHGRLNLIDNNVSNSRSNTSNNAMAELMGRREFKSTGFEMTYGGVFSYSNVSAELYNDTSFTRQNTAVYLQLNQTLWQNLKLSAGFRYEQNRVQGPEYFNFRTDIFGNELYDSLPGGSQTEGRPVMRFGMNYEINKAAHLRASYGQGYRFPTIAERFISTTFGAVPISPNPSLQSENGWTAELGYRQAMRFKGLQSYIDVAIFESRYRNMMEFNFIDLISTGFQSVNVGDTRIRGFELSSAGEWVRSDWQVRYYTGYTRIDPRFSAFDTSDQAYVDPQTEGQWNAYRSSSKENVLKYRFRHNFKMDLELVWRKWSLGSSINYLSRMEAVDAIFESFVVPDLRTFRITYPEPGIVYNLRLGYATSNNRINLLLKFSNVFNRIYSLRPGLLENGRQVMLRCTLNY